MRHRLGVIASAVALSGLLTLMHPQALRAQSKTSIEKSLLGVRILQSVNDVLRVQGPPTRIYRADETVEFLEGTDFLGNPTGGVRGLADIAAANSAGGSAGIPGGMPGGRSPSALPGGSSLSGSPLGGNGDTPSTFATSGGFIWVYFNPVAEIAKEFVFNKDNRVEMILLRGRAFGGFLGRTSQGIGLGDPVKLVYERYGYADSLEQQGSGISLNYNIKRHAQFTIINGRVAGISVFLREDQKVLYQINGPTVQNIPLGFGGASTIPGGPGGGMPGSPGPIPSRIAAPATGSAGPPSKPKLRLGK